MPGIHSKNYIKLWINDIKLLRKRAITLEKEIKERSDKLLKKSKEAMIIKEAIETNVWFDTINNILADCT